ncbi:histidine--tRNA ligase, partial [Candidatus Woesearchaeota archaeon]|nr:histidine--tRNA ligase [Candidatus Woesearchaeota archaeon]
IELDKTVTQVFIIPIKTLSESVAIAEKLRKKGIKTEVDLMERNISKNLSYANNMSIPYVLFVGQKELDQKKVKLRNMKTGKEEMLGAEGVIKKLNR